MLKSKKYENGLSDQSDQEVEQDTKKTLVYFSKPENSDLTQNKTKLVHSIIKEIKEMRDQQDSEIYKIKIPIIIPSFLNELD